MSSSITSGFHKTVEGLVSNPSIVENVCARYPFSHFLSLIF